MSDPGFAEEKGSELRPVQAVVLGRRIDRGENEGVVLLQRNTFPRAGDTYTASDVHTVSDLAVYAKARAQNEYQRWEFDGPAVVYDYNPTDKPLGELRNKTQVTLQPTRLDLESGTRLREHQDPDTHELVDTFFVLVDVFEKQRVSGLAEANVKEPATAQSDVELFASICASVQAAVADCSYTLPSVFSLPEGHPFASRTNELQIPCHPMKPSQPLLLMEGLSPQLLDPCTKTPVAVRQQIRLIPEHEKAAILTAMYSHPTVLFGVSGAGKTQLICEMLAEQYGLLFVAHRGGNGGCRDVEEALLSLLNDIKQVDVGVRTAESDQKLDGNLQTATRIFRGVLLARLLLLRALQQRFGDEMSPGLWLWMQLYPHALFGASSATARRFGDLWRKCRKLSADFLQEQITTVSLETAQTEQVLCFVDEAQVLLQHLRNEFPSDTDRSTRRSSFSALVKSLVGLCAGPLMAGTGIRMAAATQEITTAMGEKSTAIDVVCRRRGHLTPEACKQYISRYLNFEHDEADPNHIFAEELDEICQTLQGRPRFTESFVTQCLSKKVDTPVRRVSELYVSTQVTGTPFPDADPVNRWKKSIFYALKKLWDDLQIAEGVPLLHTQPTNVQLPHVQLLDVQPPHIQPSNVVAEFKRLAFRYAITGCEQVAPEADYAELIEYGLANVQRGENEDLVSVAEPLVVRAAAYFYGLLDYQKSRLRESSGCLSAVGNEFEAYVALTLFDSNRPLKLASDAPVNVNALDIPEHFVGEWKLWCPEEATTSAVLGCDSKQDEDLVNFLSDSPRCALHFPDHYAGADVFERACDIKNTQRRLQASIQLKFQKKVKNVARAVATTDLEEIFTHSDGSIIQTRAEVRERVLDAFRSSGLPLLRVLVAYPTTIEGEEPIQLVNQNELLVIIDKRNAHFVFNAEDLKMLDNIYEASQKRRMQEPRADTDSVEAGESKHQSRKRAIDESFAAALPKRRSTRESRPVRRYGVDEL